MPGQDIKIAAAEGGSFDCYLSLPESGTGPAVVVMASVFGVDDDVRDNCDVLAGQGFVAAAPDLFWRGDSGPMPRTEEGRERAAARAKDRRPMIEGGVKDLADTIAVLKSHPDCNGKIGVVGLCYGGPFAILGPARLGCDAGASFHGTKVEDWLDELDGVNAPLSLHWGDEDHAAPPETLARIREATKAMPSVDIAIYPGVGHGYAQPSSVDKWNRDAAEKSWARAVEIFDTLKDAPVAATG